MCLKYPRTHRWPAGPCLFCNSYRSPISTKVNDDDLNKWIIPLKVNYNIIGDLNYPGIEWANGTSDAKGREFYDTCNDKFLAQMVEESSGIIFQRK